MRATCTMPMSAWILGLSVGCWTITYQTPGALRLPPSPTPRMYYVHMQSPITLPPI